MRWLVDLAYLLVGFIYLPVALYQALVVGKNRSGWGARFGFVPSFDPGRRRIWIHAVSLGEINATPQLVESLKCHLPDAHFVFSTTTDTGYARAVQLYGADCVFRFPLDFSLVVARVLRRVQPSMIVLVELEVWYNLVHAARKRGIPVAVVNGRLTVRSARRLKRLGKPVRSMFGGLSWVGAQDEAIADRFRQLGVSSERLCVTSSLKWDSASVTGSIEGAEALADAVGIDRSCPVWVCGSTGPGEEEMILRAYRDLIANYSDGSDEKDAAPTLVIVPRKPERFDEVARVIVREGFSCVRRSERLDGAGNSTQNEDSVILGDTMGELRKFYSLADVVFVGRTLVPMGGSDPMEVAAMGKPMVVGPHTDNFQLPVDVLRGADALRTVASADALASTVQRILNDSSLAAGLGSRARRVVLANQGATQRTADALVRLMQGK